MKFEFRENGNGLSLELRPETIEESNKLLRVANNAKAEKPSIYFSFSGDTPVFSLWIRKINEKNQTNSIRPYKS